MKAIFKFKKENIQDIINLYFEDGILTGKQVGSFCDIKECRESYIKYFNKKNTLCLLPYVSIQNITWSEKLKTYEDYTKYQGYFINFQKLEMVYKGGYAGMFQHYSVEASKLEPYMELISCESDSFPGVVFNDFVSYAAHVTESIINKLKEDGVKFKDRYDDNIPTLPEYVHWTDLPDELFMNDEDKKQQLLKSLSENTTFAFIITDNKNALCFDVKKNTFFYETPLRDSHNHINPYRMGEGVFLKESDISEFWNAINNWGDVMYNVMEWVDDTGESREKWETIKF